MELWHWCTPLYAAMCTLFILLEFRTNSRMVRVIFKCLPLALLIGTVARNLLLSNAPVSSSAPGSVSKLSQLFWGLVFSCIGDAYLVFPDYFALGVIAFALTQSIYLSLFGGLILFQSATGIEVLLGLIVAAISCLVSLPVVRLVKPTLSILVLLYSALISMMLWSALVQAYRSLDYHTVFGAVGATMFYISDLLLCINKWKMKLPHAQVFIMSTYYSAHLCITFSVLGLN